MTVSDWINHRYGLSQREESLKEIKEFSLVWNVFEDVVCDNDFKIHVANERIVASGFDLAPFTSYLQYFQNRYVSNGQTNQLFSNLHFRKNDREDFVREVLVGELTGTNEILLALVIIVFRFRNNLFHGLKDIREIDQQKANFENANSFLMDFLDRY